MNANLLITKSVKQKFWNRIFKAGIVTDDGNVTLTKTSGHDHQISQCNRVAVTKRIKKPSAPVFQNQE
jgi:hypothetical protein